MFDFVRKHTKVMMFLMFLLIIPAFVLVGVDGFRKINGGGDVVATVASHSITQAEWDHAHKIEVDRLRTSMPTLDVKMLESPEARFVTLERLVQEQVISEAAKDSHLATSDARLARELQQDPTIAGLRKPDGTLDMVRYRQLAGSQGLSTDGFEARVRNDLSVRQVQAGLLSTAFSPTALSDIAWNAFFEKREVQIARFVPADFASKVNPTDADIDAFYQSNSALFQAQESANIEYVVLDLEAAKKSISINDSDLKSYYEQNAARLSGKEERRASHILINAPKGIPAEARQKAKDQATALLTQVRKAPDSFADVARKNSQDTGSAPSGGDLDFFARGAMVKPFEDAAFSMKKGEISELVESDFGFHIIRLTDIKTPKQRSFEELRTSIEADLKNQQVQKKFGEIAEAFTNGVYEQSDALKPIADKLKLEVKTASNLHRTGSTSVTGVLASPKLLEEIFSADSVEKKHNTKAVEIATNQLVSARVTQYTPARTLALSEVRSNVRERLVTSRSTEMATKSGTEKLGEWKINGTSATLPAAVTVSREKGQPIQGPLLDAVMRADISQLPAWVGVDLGAQGYAVVRVNKVLPRATAADANRKQENAQFSQLVAGAENQAYYQLLKDRFKVKIKIQRPIRTAIDTKASAE